MKCDDGYTTLSVFIIILFISAISISALKIIGAGLKKSHKYDNIYSIRQDMDEKVLALLDVLGNDPTPEADSFFDPVWAYIKNENKDEFQIGLRDISSKFNMNFVRTKMLEQSIFKDKMINGKSPDDLKEYRGERGFVCNLKNFYGDFFSEEDLDDFFTIYSYANFNVTYENSLKNIYEIRVSEDSGHSFLSIIQQHISSKIIADNLEYKQIVGASYTKLYPTVNTMSLMNVNFIPEAVLQAVLNYPYGGDRLKQSTSYIEIIKAERSVSEFLPEKLTSLLAVEGDYLRILQYLGTVTWFWEIIVAKERQKLDVIVCRLPDTKDANCKKFHIIKWKYHNS